MGKEDDSNRKLLCSDKLVAGPSLSLSILSELNGFFRSEECETELNARTEITSPLKTTHPELGMQMEILFTMELNKFITIPVYISKRGIWANELFEYYQIIFWAGQACWQMTNSILAGILEVKIKLR